MRRIILGTALACLGFAASAHAQGKPQIILYQEDNFRGQELMVDGPIDRIKQLRFDDRASSVRVLSGTWLLCADDVYRGRCITVDRDIAKLSRLGFDDELSSLRPVEGRRYRDRDDRDDRDYRRRH